MDGVVAAVELLLRPGLGLLRVLGPTSICVWAVGMAQTQGAPSAAGRRRLIHWSLQSMANPRW